MKNIHIIPTDKPSRLYEDVDSDLQLGYDFIVRQGMLQNQNIYITSDEEIKEGDWMHYKHFGEDIVTKYDTMGGQNTNVNEHKDYYKKIILTTDQSLNGVQTIDDEFLEWFVKNPNCEEVEVNWVKTPDGIFYHKDNVPYGSYKIIIPKEEPKQIKCYCGHTTYCDCGPEEPKQETLEEAAKDFVLSHDFSAITTQNHLANRCFQFGAKWQSDKMYSEEDLISFAHFYFKEEFNSTMQTSKSTDKILQEWFEQIKTK